MLVDSLFGVSSDFSASYRSHQITVGRCFSTCSDYFCFHWGFIIFRIANCRNEPPVCGIIHHSESLHTGSGFISGLFADLGNLLRCGIAVLLVNTARLKWVMEVYACWYCVSDQLSVWVCVWSVTWAHRASVLVFWDSCVGCFQARVQQRAIWSLRLQRSIHASLKDSLQLNTTHTLSHTTHTQTHTHSPTIRYSSKHWSVHRATHTHTHCSSYCTCQKTLTISLNISNKCVCNPDTQTMCTCKHACFN